MHSSQTSIQSPAVPSLTTWPLCRYQCFPREWGGGDTLGIRPTKQNPESIYLSIYLNPVKRTFGQVRRGIAPGLTSHDVNFLKCLPENIMVNLKKTINRQFYIFFNHSESPSSIWNYYISGLPLVTGRFGPYGSFKPNLVRPFLDLCLIKP